MHLESLPYVPQRKKQLLGPIIIYAKLDSTFIIVIIDYIITQIIHL